MAFKSFSISYLDVLMVPLFYNFLCHPFEFCPQNKALLLWAGKSAPVAEASTNGSCL